jgi:RNA polymerase sigma factor (sigma-70 family)
MNKEERFEAIYRKHYARVWRYYRACRVSDDEAHDLAQDTFKRFYERIELFRGQDEAVWPFLETIALNVLRNWLRAGRTAKRSANIVPLDDPEFSYELPAPEGPDYADREQTALRIARLRQAIAELPKGQKECLRLWMEGFTFEETAQSLRVTLDAVKSRLRDARRALRERLGDES